jgi:RNA-binding protein
MIPSPSSSAPSPTPTPAAAAPAEKLSNALVRSLKARAQRLDPVIKLGHGGMTPELVASLDAALALHELVKVKFTGLKEQKDEIAPRLAEATRSHLVWRIGHCAVLFRARPRPESAA